jgi:phosphate transport system permease protein
VTLLDTRPQVAPEPATGPDTPIVVKPGLTPGDRVFRVVLWSAGGISLAVLVAIIGYLFARSWQSLRHSGLALFVSGHWAPPVHYGLAGALAGSVMIALLALVIAVPISIAAALMINEYAPMRLRRPLVALIDLLATVPSIVYGFWGLDALSTYVFGPTKWLDHHAGGVPLFCTPESGTYGNSIFVCGLVVAVMIIPIVTSISREVMARTPRDACEAALALGGTRWGMVTDVILPFSRNGIVGGALLGLGRAIGETMAVLLILSSNNVLTPCILGPNGLGSISRLIGNYFETSPKIEQSALTMAGLLLFATTLGVNIVARIIVNRGGQGSLA